MVPETRTIKSIPFTRFLLEAAGVEWTSTYRSRPILEDLDETPVPALPAVVKDEVRPVEGLPRVALVYKPRVALEVVEEDQTQGPLALSPVRFDELEVAAQQVE